MTRALWDSYLATARERYEEIDRAERFKIDLGKALTRAREALLRDERDWSRLVTAAITHKQNNIINWRDQSKLVKWIDGNVGEARDALSEMWSGDDRTFRDRVRSFDGGLPESAAGCATATRFTCISSPVSVPRTRYGLWRRLRSRRCTSSCTRATGQFGRTTSSVWRWTR